MVEEIFKRLPVEELDITGVEDWLEQMALKGYFFYKIIFGWWYFKIGEPQEVRYRIDPGIKKANEIESEKKDDYEALGWHYIYTHKDFYHIFMADAQETEELHTDPPVEKLALKRLERMLWFSLAPCVSILVIQYLIFPNARERLLTVIKYPLVYLTSVEANTIIMYLILLYLAVQTCFTLKKMHTLRKELAEGKDIRYESHIRKRKKYKSLKSGITMMIMLLFTP